MIDATHLRIDNLLFCGKKQNLVEVLSLHFELRDNWIWTINNIPADEFSPIPLTSEILVEWFGFEKSERHYKLPGIFNYTEIAILVDDNKYILQPYQDDNFNQLCTGMIEIEIHSVHQLQNLFFALTGKELERKTK